MYNGKAAETILLYLFLKNPQSKAFPLLTRLILAVLLILVIATIPLHNAVMAKNNNNNNNDHSGNTVIIGTRSYTKGTNHDDTIISCPVLSIL